MTQPRDLDEAAEKYADERNPHCIGEWRKTQATTWVRDNVAFKAGAAWQEARIAELEAACAEMREALESAHDEFLEHLKPRHECSHCENAMLDCAKALARPAGQALLERVRRLEKVMEAAKEIKTGFISFKAIENLNEALDELDGGKQT